MTERKFKVGDRVRAIDTVDTKRPSGIGIVKYVDKIHISVEFNEFVDGHGGTENSCMSPHGWNYHKEEFYKLELVESAKDTKPDNMERFMVYGTGCDNKSNLVTTEKELKDMLKAYIHDSSWTGRIIGYKLVPLYEAEKSVKFQKFEKSTKVAKKRGRGRPKKSE